MQNDNTIAIISYMFPIGWIIAFIMANDNKKTAFNLFHLRQSLGVNIFWILFGITRMILSFIPFGNFLSLLLFATIITLAIIGFVAALNSEQKYIPIVGEYFEETFRNFIK